MILTVIASFLLLALFFAVNRKPRRSVYLLDFACYKPPASQMCTKNHAAEQARQYANLSEENTDFCRKTMHRAGLGDSTYLPECFLEIPYNPCMEKAKKEAEMSMYGCIDKLLAKTGVLCKDIGILIVNCTVFTIVPSLSSMIVNKYKLKDNIITYNLGGMGCSAGLVAIGLAKQLLQVYPNSYALVVSTENITENAYKGKERSMMLINCAFRVGGAAILLSNRPSDRQSSNYELIHTVHTHTARSDQSYNTVMREEDHEGYTGIKITKNLLIEANKAIELNLAMLDSMILPIGEQIKFNIYYMMRKVYVPNFKKVIDHFCTHVGGKPVMDELQRNLGISDFQMEPSRMTMYRFGNSWSSSVWYVLSYAEAKGRIKRGDRVWQIAFGAGFKCSSVVWRAIRNVDYDEMNPWTAEIDQFPVVLDHLGAVPYYLESPKAA